MSQAGLGGPLPTFHTADAAATIEFGRSLAKKLKPGDVVAFYGDLGAGKTTMIKGVCAGLGVTEVVKSPSFVIVTEYNGMNRQERQDGQTNHRDTEARRFRGSDKSTVENRKSEIPYEPPRPPRAPSPNRDRLLVYHIDLYRIGGTESQKSEVRSQKSEIEKRKPELEDGADELEGIDFEGYLEAGGVCLIEWAERAESLLPERTIRVRLALEGRGRRVEVEEPGRPEKSEIR